MDALCGLVRGLLAFLVDGDGTLPSWSTATSFRLCALVRALGFVMLCVVCAVWYYGLADYDASSPMWLHANYQNWISTSAVCLFCRIGRKPGMKHPRVIKEYNLLFTLLLIHGTHFCAHRHFHQIRFQISALRDISS